MARTNRITKTLLGHAAVALGLMATSAGAQELCSVYSVQKGDTLSGIASSAGVKGGFQTIYNANRDTLASPNIIEINQKIVIPCADGTLPGQAAAAKPVETATAEPAATEEPKPAGGPLPKLKFLTASDYAPFTDEELPEGGMFTELVRRATERGAPDLEYSVTFVNDWGSHLSDLLPSGAFDGGFPWFLPDCSKVDLLSPAMQLRCNDYDATEPFFEVVIGWYAKSGSDLLTATSYDALKGLRICRPDGWFTFDLEALELVEPKIPLLLRAPSQVDCWRALQNDEVDIVTFDALPAEDDIVSLNISDEVKEITGLSSVVTAHVFVPKGNPNGPAYIALLNEGLKEMRDDGSWFSIVSQRLREHEEKQAAGN
ncbi:MAG: LysM peptidoglycan-binding domain-containing protein [Tabrizicola sp.]|nr:LysM peptidoglycan-binding domain-containing protein [Tabrizicola sp.]